MNSFRTRPHLNDPLWWCVASPQVKRRKKVWACIASLSPIMAQFCWLRPPSLSFSPFLGLSGPFVCSRIPANFPPLPRSRALQSTANNLIRGCETKPLNVLFLLYGKIGVMHFCSLPDIYLLNPILWITHELSYTGYVDGNGWLPFSSSLSGFVS